MKSKFSLEERNRKRKEYMDNYSKEYSKRNKEKISEYKKNYYLLNKNNIDRRRKISKEWYLSQNKDKYREHKRKWENSKRKLDNEFRIKKLLRGRIIKAFKNYSKIGKTMSSDEYGIDYKMIIDKLIKKLPNDFKEKEYQIDHIKPCCIFDLTDLKQVKQCFSPENHQWLSLKEHKEKTIEDMKKYRLKIN